MNTRSTAFNNASAEATISDRILQIALAAWRQGNFVEVVDQFDGQFTFTDHALGLEFKDKERLTEFLAKIGERFPDSERRTTASSAAQTTSLVNGRLRLQILNLFWAGVCEKYPFACKAYRSCR